jgi:hypothetical protein
MQMFFANIHTFKGLQTIVESQKGMHANTSNETSLKETL